MKHRYGVIDLGTNTFHLLIAEQNESDSIRELYREQRFVKLAEDGIQKIGLLPYRRGLEALRDYKKILDEYEVTEIRALGTAALRTAINGKEFIDQVLLQTGLKIQLISGEEEADLIQKGVRIAVAIPNGNSLIMDIGGGSVEFIIINAKRVLYTQSFPVGIAVLYHSFSHSDPISSAELDAIDRHLDEVLNPLKTALQVHKPNTLIGASGTFDVLVNLLVKGKEQSLSSLLSLEQYLPLYEQIVKSTVQQRLQMEGIPTSRVDLIVMALILIKYVVGIAGIKNIVISAYAMKEGMLWEMMSKPS